MNDQLLGKARVQPMNFSENGGNKFAAIKILVFCPKKISGWREQTRRGY
jgi:hypothetical protein